MPLTARPLHPLFAAEISGVAMAGPIDRSMIAEIVAAMDRYAVCVFHNAPPLTDAEHVAFSGLLGPMQRTAMIAVAGKGNIKRASHPEIIDQGNVDEYGEIFADGDRHFAFKRANRLWHTDMSFHPVRATYSLLSAVELPEDGGPDTEFADMRAAYDALPAPLKAGIEDLVVEHSYWHSRVVGGGPEPTAEELASRPPAHHRLVQVHPGSGRKTLYLASHARAIVGMAQPDATALLAELTALATRPQFVFSHHWRLGDVVIWDNRCTMHRARPFDDRLQRRDVRRTTCRERAVA